jgi:hypothetical protein
VRGIVHGDAIPQLFIPRLIEMYRAGAFPFGRLVRFYDFDEINQALADAQERRGHRTPLSHRVGEIKKERVSMATSKQPELLPREEPTGGTALHWAGG